ncbi:MAG: hypothetical protein ACWGPR_08455 [Candidatus Deferrimicrobiaceae bacterium]
MVRNNGDGEWRVVYAPQGRVVASFSFPNAENFARCLRKNAKRARANIDDDATTVRRAAGIVASSGGRVVVLYEGRVVATYAPDVAEMCADRIQSHALIGELNHWHDVDKHHTGGVRVKRLFSLPVCSSIREYERLGDRK